MSPFVDPSWRACGWAGCQASMPRMWWWLPPLRQRNGRLAVGGAI